MSFDVLSCLTCHLRQLYHQVKHFKILFIHQYLFSSFLKCTCLFVTLTAEMIKSAINHKNAPRLLYLCLPTGYNYLPLELRYGWYEISVTLPYSRYKLIFAHSKFEGQKSLEWEAWHRNAHMGLLHRSIYGLWYR